MPSPHEGSGRGAAAVRVRGRGPAGGGDRRVLPPALAALLVAAALLAAAAPLKADGGLEIWPAWEGWVRPGRTTELTLVLWPERGGEYTVRVRAGGLTLRQRLEGAAGTPLRLALPLRPDGVEPIRIEIQGPGVEPPVTARWTPAIAPPGPLLAVSLAPGALAAAGGADPARDPPPMRIPGAVHVPASALPRWPGAYATPAALVLDAWVLERLTPAQRTAIEAHLAGCGAPVVLVGRAHLEPPAACPDRLRAVAGPEEVAAALEDLPAAARLPTPPRPPATPAGRDHPGVQVAAFLLGYLLLLLVPGARAGPRLVALPLAAAALALVAWGRAPPLVRWLPDPASAGGPEAAPVVLYGEVIGRGRGEAVLPLPAALDLPRPHRHTRAEALLDLPPEPAAGNALLRIPTTLLSRYTFSISGDPDLLARVPAGLPLRTEETARAAPSPGVPAPGPRGSP